MFEWASHRAAGRDEDDLACGKEPRWVRAGKHSCLRQQLGDRRGHGSLKSLAGRWNIAVKENEEAFLVPPDAVTGKL